MRFSLILAQPNCEVFKKDSLCYNGCLEIYKADMHPQGSHASQRHFDIAIKDCPTLAYSYFEKSVAFLKRGYFLEWKKLIDKAIELEPKDYLFYRAWCQFFFLRNYDSAKADLETLKELYKTPFFGMGQNGDYDLRVVLALCYRLTGDRVKAIKIIKEAISEKDFVIGQYDYLHLGVMYLESNQPDKAIRALENQKNENDIAEVHFYLGKAYCLQGDSERCKDELNEALHLYDSGRNMHSNYYEYIDQIYREDILNLLNTII